MFTKDIGIDLGTANTLVYMKGRGIIMRKRRRRGPAQRRAAVRSVGHEAKAVIGATRVHRGRAPLKDGVIADFDITAAMLQSFIRQACGNSIFARPGGHLRAVLRHRGRAPRRAPGSSQGGRTPGHSH